ncbi:hypothetical protein ABZ707_10415 [Streptomyces sp. NPDC006923]|uniref:hypothetical protein n=1 Tax=Streptomyces sp. NPDC006923 TaxID=3155355 RepID=UPI0033F679E4
MCAALIAGIATSPAYAYDFQLPNANGSATVWLTRDAGFLWEVCDDAPDGMRAMATISTSYDSITLTAAGTAGTCDEGRLYPNPLPGETVNVKVWVQNGANGAQQHVRRGIYYP